jgi:hypothetical protein
MRFVRFATSVKRDIIIILSRDLSVTRMQPRFYAPRETPEKSKVAQTCVAVLLCNYAGAIINIPDSVVIARALHG